jgi:hypothetical protein
MFAKVLKIRRKFKIGLENKALKKRPLNFIFTGPDEKPENESPKFDFKARAYRLESTP